MSRHDGVSCDSCLKSNFRGKRYKCLICYDYDLCATCYEAGATTTRHTTDHPVQCILTRSDIDIFFGGEALTAEQPQAFSCPYCSKMGFTEALLQEHVTADHADTSVEVVCPICASLPGGDPNHVTDDLAAHLTLEHRAPREIDEQHTGIRHVRRIPHPGRGVGGARTRRTTNMHFSSGGSTLTGLSPSGRENMDPIAELLSQLSSVRSRAAAAQSVSSQLQQLEMQLQTTRQQLERLPRRPAEASKTTASTAAPTSTEPQGGAATGGSAGGSSSNSLFLLSRCVDSVISESDTDMQQDKLARSLFVQEMLLSTVTEQLHLGDEGLENFDNLLANVTPPRKEDKGQPQKDDSVEGPTENISASASSKSASEASSTKNLQKHVEKDKVGGTKQKAAVSSGGLPVGRSGAQCNRVPRQGTGVYQSQGHSQQFRQNALMQHSVELANNLSMNVAVGGGGANYDTENPQPLPGRPGSGGRDGRLNPPAAKRNMVKHLPTSKTSDREPPPH